MAEESCPTRRSVLLEEVFRALDSKQRGFVSKVELAHILDAMQADAKGPMPIPEALLPHKISRDCKVSPQDLTGWLEALSVAELEDVKWFAESVVKVESELREVWLHAVKRWQEAVVQLQSRDLHRYLLSSQPSRVARWLQLRTDPSEPVGLPGLGFSQHEVETLFADETADDINACHEHIEPFLLAVQLREELGQLKLSADTAGLASELLTKLVQLASSRDLACLLTHEETLGLATSLVGVDGVPQQVTVEASKLIMTILGHRIHESCRNVEDNQLSAVSLEFAMVIQSQLLMPETLDALNFAEASALCTATFCGVWPWRNLQIRHLARLQKLPRRRVQSPATICLRRLEVSHAEAFGGMSWNLLLEPLAACGGAHLQELCLGHCLINAGGQVPHSCGFWTVLRQVTRQLHTLQLPHLVVCAPGGSPAAFADGASAALPAVRALQIPHATLIECRPRSLVAEAVSSQTACWEALVREICTLSTLREVDITGAWRPIDPAHIRSLPDDGPSGSATSNFDSLGEVGRLVPCDEDVLTLFDSWRQRMSEINALFNPTVKVVHEDWDLCRQTLQSYLEVAFDPLEVPGSPGQAGAGQRLGTISRWVENLVMQQSDLDRGEMVDKLIKYDEQRLLAAEQESVPESLFSHGRTIHIVLSRLDLASHYSLHERRTPIRTHLLKFLLNVLSSSGDRGRSLFRAGGGMAAICSVLRGDAWGEVRPELPLAVELDQPDHTKKDDAFSSTGSWPGLGDEPRYYEADFADNKFYGPKDRVLAAAFLEFLGSEELWGDNLLDEFCQSAEVLQAQEQNLGGPSVDMHSRLVLARDWYSN
ncbi:Ctss [Symbiodinium sp. CCMP2592]|nr:Ctss [Symbiodinium sp. CCMP2592]